MKFIEFTKMHGAGNDYVYVNGFANLLPHDLEKLAIDISHRRFGVGADGLILILPSDKADARMRMFNADGSESEMCGNGIRCFAQFLKDLGADGAYHVYIHCGLGSMNIVLIIIHQGDVRLAGADAGFLQYVAVERVPFNDDAV